jgi:hypothetical protein
MEMERVRTLLKKMQEQLDAGAPVDNLMLTASMLLAELQQQRTVGAKPAGGDVAIDIPLSYSVEVTKEAIVPEPEAKVLKLLEVDEAAVEAELEEIRRKAEERKRIAIQSKPAVQFDALEETPTLNTQVPAAPGPSEINDTVASNQSSLNDRFVQDSPELSETLKEPPVNDLRKAIGVNDRYLFINDLFRGDEAMYDRSIKTINGFNVAEDAEQWIMRELKVKLGWDEESHAVQQFDHLVRRRFS